MQNSEERVALQAVEFWSTVCEEEAELAAEAAEVCTWLNQIYHLLNQGVASGIRIWRAA